MNKLMRVVKSVVLIAFASVTGLAFAGICNWTGNGSDNKWGTPANWDAPLALDGTDELVLTNAGTTENDIDNLVIKRVEFAGSSAAVLNGKKITFTGFADYSTLLKSVVTLTLNTPLELPAGKRGQTDCQTIGSPTTFNGAITLGDGSVLRLGPGKPLDSGASPKLTFNAPVTGLQAGIITIHGCNGNCDTQGGIWFYAPVKVKYISSAIKNGANNVHFCATGNQWERFNANFTRICPEAVNAFCETSVLDWQNFDLYPGIGYWDYIGLMTDNGTDDYGVSKNACYDLKGYDQTIDRLESYRYPISWDSKYVNTFSICSTEKPATLTMKATANGRCFAKVNGHLSLVWDPKGDYTMTFSNRLCKTCGSIEVKKGSVRIEKLATFPNVPSIAVGNGASFVLDVTSTNALAGLQSLTLAPNATFSVAATAVTPFGSATPAMSLRTASHLVIPTGMTLTVSELMLDGLRIYGKTYNTGDEGCGWLTGGGSLVVAAEGPHTGYSWRNALDGDWSTAASWLGGVVPGQTDAAEVAVPYDGNYAAKINGDLAYDGDLTVANAGGGVATVEVASGTWTRGGTKLAMNKGGAIAVDNGAKLNFLANYSGVKVDGGCLAVKNGGTVDMTADAGGSTFVSGGGVVRVEAGGELKYKGYNLDGKTSRCFNVGAGSKLEIAGRGWFRNNEYWGHGLYTSGGDIEATGTGALDVKVTSQGGVLGNGTVTLKDNATFYLTNAYARAQIPTSRENVHEEVTINFEDHAKLTATSYLLLGNNRLGKPTDSRNSATLNFNSDATSTTDMIYLGVPNGLATINLANGTLRAGASIQAGSVLASSIDCQAYYTWASYTWKPEGRINVTGGDFSVNGSSYDIMGMSSSPTLVGLILGNGVTMKDSASSTYAPYAAGYAPKGSLNISGGTVTIQKWGSLIVGGGYGSGTIDQTGGTLSKVCSNNEGYPVIIGFLSGTGSYTMGGGTATIASDLYVGGVTKSELGWNGLLTSGKNYSGTTFECDVRDAATGTLTVTGGTMTVAKDVIVSRDGKGTINVGEGGTLKAKNITLDAGSTVNYKFGADGSGTIETTGTLTVAPGTVLNIDASDYTGEKGVTLMKWGEKSGDFTVNFTQPKGSACRLIVSDNGIRMTSGKGLIITIR